MNETINKFLFTGDTFMPELVSKQPVLFTIVYNSACRPFTKHRKRIQKRKKTGNLKHSYRNELDKGSFAYNATYPDGKYWAKRTISD